jgi:hypothetical protein
MSTTTDSPFERMCDAILDHGSTSIYGDERDRYHWYEAIAVGASIQWIAIPWALAILAAVDAERFGPALWTLFATWIIPILVMNAYAQRRRVSEVTVRTRAATGTVLATWIPLIAFLAIMVRPAVETSRSARIAGVLVGGFAALCLMVVLRLVRSRRAR